MTASHHSTDVLVIGTGTAGLTLALCLAPHHRVTVISKDELESGSSPYAQGGIAAVLQPIPADLESHVQDTLNAGAGRCDSEVVRYIVNQGQTAIEWLVDQGVLFTREQHNNALHLTQEGGHSKRRIVHAQDKTGYAIMQTLHQQVRQQPQIHVLPHHIALDLVTDNNQCLGAKVWDEASQQIVNISAQTTVLATGGANSLYQHATSDCISSGDGIAMAHRAGCDIQNMAFFQFHPTRFYHPDSPPFLITEAMRGEGAKLTLPDGTPFLHHHDPRAELAPRDIVARAMHAALTQHQLNYLTLNIASRPADTVRQLFPSIHHHCAQYGIDITRDHIPVVPAAHYTCGGIKTDIAGKTNLAHLYAIGETACTGLHGANRMASNSLLECVVMAMTAAQSIQSNIVPGATPTVLPNSTTHAEHHIEARNAQSHTTLLQQTLWQHAGIVRSHSGLNTAKQHITQLQQTLHDNSASPRPNRQSIELRNLTDCAQLTVDDALAQQRNCGAHYNQDLCASTSEQQVTT